MVKIIKERKREKKKKMSEKKNSLKKEIGERFKQFRLAIKKTQHQLSREVNVYQSTITNIELGKTFIKIKYLHFFQCKYRLNANWLLSEQGEMFISDEPIAIPTSVSVLGCHISDKDPRFPRYVDLVDLMQVPVIEQVILAKLTELKVLAKDEILEFREKKRKINC